MIYALTFAAGALCGGIGVLWWLMAGVDGQPESGPYFKGTDRY